MADAENPEEGSAEAVVCAGMNSDGETLMKAFLALGRERGMDREDENGDETAACGQ